MYGQPGYGQPQMQQPYGQPQMQQPYGQPQMQQPYGQPMMPQNAGMMPNMMQGYGAAPMGGPQPAYREIMRGKGIDQREYTTIINAATFAYTSHQTPLSTAVSNAIKGQIGGEWLVIMHPVGQKYDFCMTCVKGGDFFSFSLDQTQFQVCRIK